MLKRKGLIILALALILLFATMLVGCSADDDELEGKSIVTFDLNGGTISYKMLTDSKGKFAYEPGTYVIDPNEISGCEIYYYDEDAWKYIFTGWYSTAECRPEDKWDFSLAPVGEEGLTLYAGWEKQTKYTYQLYYLDGQTPVKLGDYYRVAAGDKFNDRLNRSKRVGYTKLEFYSDAALTVKWDEAFTHPGGESDTEIPVYVSYIEGEWELVDSYAKLKSAITGGKNAYLLGDINCEGNELSFMDGKSYNGVIEGNGHTVSDFTVTSNGRVGVKCAMFYSLGENAAIRNVSLEGVKYVMTDINISSDRLKLQVAALALSASGASVQNVTVTGEMTTVYEGELPRLNEAIYDAEGSTVSIDGFSVSITVSLYTENT